MNIRLAELSDLEAVCALDHSYQTDHVWQLSGKNGVEEMSAMLRLAKLPRAMSVRSPHDPDVLRRTLHRADFLWVIDGEAPGVGAQHGIVGYISMTLLPWQHTGWVTSLAVRPDARRTGLATRLLARAKEQARVEGMHSITVDVPTKNYPVTRLCLRCGMYFCGYAENYYASHDIALFFATKIRQ